MIIHQFLMQILFIFWHQICRHSLMSITISLCNVILSTNFSCNQLQQSNALTVQLMEHSTRLNVIEKKLEEAPTKQYRSVQQSKEINWYLFSDYTQPHSMRSLINLMKIAYLALLLRTWERIRHTQEKEERVPLLRVRNSWSLGHDHPLEGNLISWRKIDFLSPL